MTTQASRCRWCGLELTTEQSHDGSYRHYHPETAFKYYFCYLMAEELQRSRAGLGQRRGTPFPEEDIVTKVLMKYSNGD